MSGEASRRKPRWSSAPPPAPVPAPIAGLAAVRASVFVGPPLLAGEAAIPALTLLKPPVVIVAPQLVPVSPEWLPVNPAELLQFASVLLARIVLVTEALAAAVLSMPSPAFPAIVSWFNVAVPPSSSPSNPLMEFVSVEFVIVPVPPALMLTALPVLPDRREWSMNNVPPLRTTTPPFDG